MKLRPKTSRQVHSNFAADFISISPLNLNARWINECAIPDLENHPQQSLSGSVGPAPLFLGRVEVNRLTSLPDDRKIFFDHPNPNSMIFCCVASPRPITPTTVPPRIMAMRSLSPRISGSSDEIIMIAIPASARL